MVWTIMVRRAYRFGGVFFYIQFAGPEEKMSYTNHISVIREDLP